MSTDAQTLKKKLGNILKNIRNGTITSLKLSDDEIRQETAIAFAKALAQNKTITSLELRYNEIEEEKAIEFAKALAQNETIKTLKLTTHLFFENNVRYRGAVVLAEALKVNSTITHVDLERFFIGDEGAIALAEALAVNKTITFLNLSKNNILRTGVQKLAEALEKNQSIKSLNLSINNIGPFGARKLALALKKNSTLSELNLKSTRIQSTGVKALTSALKVNKVIQKIDLSSNNLVKVAEALYDALIVNTTLTSINLSWNQIRATGATALAEALKVNNTVKSLVLAYTKIGPVGATALAEALKVNSSITTLDLFGNQIRATGATALAEGLKSNSSITHVDLGGNYDIGPVGVTALAEVLKVNSTITEIKLLRNNIGPVGATALAEALKVNSTITMVDLPYNNVGDIGATALAEAFKVNSTITSLYLDDNQIGYFGATALAEGLKLNKSIIRLDISDNRIGDEGMRVLAEGLKVNKTLTSLTVDYNDIGATGATALANAFNVNNTITYLSVSNRIGEIGLTALSKALELNQSLKHIKLYNYPTNSEQQYYKIIKDQLFANRVISELIDLFKERILRFGSKFITDIQQKFLVGEDLAEIETYKKKYTTIIHTPYFESTTDSNQVQKSENIKSIEKKLFQSFLEYKEVIKKSDEKYPDLYIPKKLLYQFCRLHLDNYQHHLRLKVVIPKPESKKLELEKKFLKNQVLEKIGKMVRLEYLHVFSLSNKIEDFFKKYKNTILDSIVKLNKNKIQQIGNLQRKKKIQQINKRLQERLNKLEKEEKDKIQDNIILSHMLPYSSFPFEKIETDFFKEYKNTILDNIVKLNKNKIQQIGNLQTQKKIKQTNEKIQKMKLNTLEKEDTDKFQDNILFYMLPDSVIQKYFDERNFKKKGSTELKRYQRTKGNNKDDMQIQKYQRTKGNNKDDMQLQQPNVKVLSHSSTGDRSVQYKQNGLTIRKEIQSSAKKNKQQAKNKRFYQVRSEPTSSSPSFLHILDEDGNEIEMIEYSYNDERLSKKIQQLEKKGYQNYSVKK